MCFLCFTVIVRYGFLYNNFLLGNFHIKGPNDVQIDLIRDLSNLIILIPNRGRTRWQFLRSSRFHEATMDAHYSDNEFEAR